MTAGSCGQNYRVGTLRLTITLVTRDLGLNVVQIGWQPTFRIDFPDWVAPHVLGATGWEICNSKLETALLLLPQHRLIASFHLEFLPLRFPFHLTRSSRLS